MVWVAQMPVPRGTRPSSSALGTSDLGIILASPLAPRGTAAGHFVPPPGDCVPAGKGGGPGVQAVLSSPRRARCIPWRKGTVSESPQSGRGPKEDFLAAELSPGAWGQSSAWKELLSGLREDPLVNPGKITGQGSSSISALLG